MLKTNRNLTVFIILGPTSNLIRQNPYTFIWRALIDMQRAIIAWPCTQAEWQDNRWQNDWVANQQGKAEPVNNTMLNTQIDRVKVCADSGLSKLIRKFIPAAHAIPREIINSFINVQSWRHGYIHESRTNNLLLHRRLMKHHPEVDQASTRLSVEGCSVSMATRNPYNSRVALLPL